jgi:hypothetical protein
MSDRLEPLRDFDLQRRSALSAFIAGSVLDHGGWSPSRHARRTENVKDVQRFFGIRTDGTQAALPIRRQQNEKVAESERKVEAAQ